ncbi:RNA-directed DNA polymerase from mobile element jockey [Eumeta japonica]|uniref:RNA-directed DNA polymerase from mobile element jockey n=1 Tax=Eumeta variegata TaxID=151549 RepID=A0A4C1ZN84_EUMVA|nr:RNA-directed DNA polymerase from mobile element jockey [Eumeta japonica]
MPSTSPPSSRTHLEELQKETQKSGGVRFALFADDSTFFLRSCNVGHIIPRLQRTIDKLTQWFQFLRIEVNPEKSAAIYFDYSAKKRTQVVSTNTTTLRMFNAPIPWQYNYKYLGITLNKHLHFRNHIRLVRNLELPTISKYMKNASERFFSIAVNHPNTLISSAASYEAPPANHFIRRPWNVLTNPPDDFTAEVEILNNALKNLEK